MHFERTNTYSFSISVYETVSFVSNSYFFLGDPKLLFLAVALKLCCIVESSEELSKTSSSRALPRNPDLFRSGGVPVVFVRILLGESSEPPALETTDLQ